MRCERGHTIANLGSKMSSIDTDIQNWVAMKPKELLYCRNHILHKQRHFRLQS